MKFLIAVALLLPCTVLAADLTGPARVVDGDSLEIQGQRIRLYGIDAPEAKQLCQGPAQTGQYDCGLEAARALAKIVGQSPVRCVSTRQDRYQRELGVCFVGNVEINRQMIREGWATTYLADDYLADQRVAQIEKRGLWAGTFTPPQEFRREARPPEPAQRAPQTAQQPQKDIDLQSGLCAATAIMSATISPAQMGCFLRFFSSLSGPMPAQTGRQPLQAPALPERMPQSIAEVGQMVLKCYHPTGELVRVSVLDHPWRDQHAQWNAKHSALIRVDWRGGFIGLPYVLVVGLVERDGQLRAVVQADNAGLPPSPNCPLRSWVSMKS